MFPQTASLGRCFRGCNHSLMFRLPYLLGPLTVPTKGLNVPLGLRAVYTGQNLFRYWTQAPASLRVRNRTIDTAGLAVAFRHPAPARSQPCRLLLHPSPRCTRYFSFRPFRLSHFTTGRLTIPYPERLPHRTHGPLRQATIARLPMR